ncbi:ribonuclease P protein component [Arthrobacter castelli]|uniref:ribonuclease P protein component n=1 Tax=Arthrobacter castelli TaxID=271431 RepID=UPI0006878796|nr:ribonuclease P protein component [Arthrobacter castelli]
MLPVGNRVRTSGEFSRTVRSGTRFGCRNLVLYADLTAQGEATRAGFIVSKSVGNAVTRNLVKRRLRELARLMIAEHPAGVSVVVRALPPAAAASWQQLAKDYQRAWAKVVGRIGTVNPVWTEKGQER